MKYISILLLFSSFLILLSCDNYRYEQVDENTAKKYFYEQVDESTAKKYFKNYIKSDTTVIRKLFSEDLANSFLDTNRRVESLAISEDEINELGEIFGENIPGFESIKPKGVKIDGYRIHYGIDVVEENIPKIAFTVTFGIEKKKDIRLLHSGKPSDTYLNDSLKLGIYKIILPENFKYSGKLKGAKVVRIATHFSCVPDCEGDKIR